MRQGACVGLAPETPEEPDLWFPERGENQTPGKLVCMMCKVRPECKEFSERTGSTYGIWSGEIKKRGTGT